MTVSKALAGASEWQDKRLINRQNRKQLASLLWRNAGADVGLLGVPAELEAGAGAEAKPRGPTPGDGLR